MSNKRTIGYIVVGGDDTPLRWLEHEDRFYRGIYGKNDRPAVTIFPDGSDGYNAARRAIAHHYKTCEKMAYPHYGELLIKFNDLRVVRLIAP